MKLKIKMVAAIMKLKNVCWKLSEFRRKEQFSENIMHVNPRVKSRTLFYRQMHLLYEVLNNNRNNNAKTLKTHGIVTLRYCTWTSECVVWYYGNSCRPVSSTISLSLHKQVTGLIPGGVTLEICYNSLDCSFSNC